MKAKNVIAMTVCLIPALAFLSSCVTPAPTEFAKPTYDNSHALLIEQTIRELPIAEAIRSVVSPRERIVVASVETTERRDYGVNYMIDDNLIHGLTIGGYTVLDRDPHLLAHIRNEHAETYFADLTRRHPDLPIFVFIRQIQQHGFTSFTAEQLRGALLAVQDREAPADQLRALSSSDVTRLAELARMLQDDYDRILNEQISFSSLRTADVLVAYRVLETGLNVDVETEQIPNEPSGFTAGTVNRTLWTHRYNRTAIARLFIRVVDTNTGEVRLAQLLEHRNSDMIEFTQGEGELLEEYRSRMQQYQRMLEHYRFGYYDHQLPNQRGYDVTPIETFDRTGTEAAEQRRAEAAETTASPPVLGDEEFQTISAGGAIGAVLLGTGLVFALMAALAN